jgi:hypothetical protein
LADALTVKGGKSRCGIVTLIETHCGQSDGAVALRTSLYTVWRIDKNRFEWAKIIIVSSVTIALVAPQSMEIRLRWLGLALVPFLSLKSCLDTLHPENKDRSVYFLFPWSSPKLSLLDASMARPPRQIVLTTAISCLLVNFAKANCFLPNGTDINKLLNVATDNWLPCSKDGDSMCCRTGGAYPDTCKPNGLCHNDIAPNLWRESCTDPSWRSPACVQLCVQINLVNTGNPNPNCKSIFRLSSWWAEQWK